ncbi:hypothetical protein FHG87_012012 [Trinorchestia longiramus]|nr:hypothetical protein FHG87_012012 [Trinorchestia longiramus]
MTSCIRYALLLAVFVAMASGERDLDRIIPGRPVPGVAPGIQPLSAGVQTKPLPRPSQQGAVAQTKPLPRPSQQGAGVQTKPLPRPSQQQGGFAIPDPSRPQVQPRPSDA